MGSLHDELKKWFGKAGHRVERTANAKQIPSTPAPTQPKQNDSDWKRGVTPNKSGGTGAKVIVQKRSILNLRKWASRGGIFKATASSQEMTAPKQGSRASGLVVGASSPVPPLEARDAQKPVSGAQGSSAPSVLRFGSARQPLLAREHEFKDPDPWVADGAELQAPQGGTGRVLPVRIGVDFGTAYTKVAIRAADKVFFVPWSGLRNSEIHYLLPGELCRIESDSLRLGRSPSAAEVRSDLKLPFLSSQSSTPAQQTAATAFLALVIRYARAWLYHTHSPLVSGRTLAWELNLGCPTNSWSSGTLRGVYERVAVRAWQLSQAKVEISWEGAVALLGPLNASLEELGLDGAHLMPEFIAQIAGYVRSPQRKNGLHMLMDVGAGTVDVATFNVAYDNVREEDRYPIFASEVLPLGTHFLMATRLRSLGREQTEWDDLQAIPDEDELAMRFNADRHRVQTADVEFATRLRREIKRVLSYTRTHRYGKAPEWREGLPVFLSGGGSDCDIYSRALVATCASCNVPHRRTSFPLLDEAAAGGSFKSSEFHRLSVAYGLTFDAQSVGRILAPHEVDDAPAYDPAVDTPRERPDRDELYPK